MKNWLTVALCLASTAVAHAGAPQAWSFDESTTGQDVVWTSPTPVNPAAELYAGVYEITLVQVTVPIFGLPVDVNVTDQVPPELRIGAGEALGPAPVTLATQSVVFPDPPAAPTIAADISVTLDADGHGVLTATNVVLGTYDAGFPVGIVQIQALRIAGQVTVTPTTLADVTRDGRVNVDDLVAVITAWGICPVPPGPCPADTNLDGTVGVDDLVRVIVEWGG